MSEEVKTKWTKGPWSAEGPDAFGDYNVCPPHEEAVVAAVVSNVRPLQEVAYNATLIAAAPDLFEALRRSEWGCYDRDVDLRSCPVCAGSERTGHVEFCGLKNALAKAQGLS